VAWVFSELSALFTDVSGQLTRLGRDTLVGERGLPIADRGFTVFIDLVRPVSNWVDPPVRTVESLLLGAVCLQFPARPPHADHVYRRHSTLQLPYPSPIMHGIAFGRTAAGRAPVCVCVRAPAGRPTPPACVSSLGFVIGCIYMDIRRHGWVPVKCVACPAGIPVRGAGSGVIPPLPAWVWMLDADETLQCWVCHCTRMGTSWVDTGHARCLTSMDPASCAGSGVFPLLSA
jgi:hypothetical protein